MTKLLIIHYFVTVYRLNPQRYGYKRRLIKQSPSQMKMTILILIQLIYHDMQHSWYKEQYSKHRHKQGRVFLLLLAVH